MKKSSEKPISLRPLKFKEAVADLLKVKPPEKPRKPNVKRSRKSGISYFSSSKCSISLSQLHPGLLSAK